MRFFVLGRLDVGTYETQCEAIEPQNIGDAPTCPKCGEYVGMLPWLPPYRATLKAFGRDLGDIAYGAGMSLLVSNRFRQAWLDAGLQGIEEFSPVERLRVRPPRLFRTGLAYFHVTPRQHGTRLDLARSMIDRTAPPQCDYCLTGGIINGMHGLAINESSWTGEDIFIAWGSTGTIFVTDRVRQLRDEHGLKNIELTPAEDYIWDPLQKWSAKA